LEKYYDMYDIQLADVEEAELGFENNEDLGDLESLKALKTLLHRLHAIRRVFLCSLLAIDADGGYSDCTRWGLAVEQLRSLGNLIAELAGELRKILTEEERECMHNQTCICRPSMLMASRIRVAHEPSCKYSAVTG